MSTCAKNKSIYHWRGYESVVNCLEQDKRVFLKEILTRLSCGLEQLYLHNFFKRGR